MTRLPSEVLRVAASLEKVAGSFLKSTIREPGATCSVCAVPVETAFTRCFRCNQHSKSGYLLADRVGSLVYAIKPDSQTYLLVSNYKADNQRFNVDTHKRQMRALLALGLRGHSSCANKLARGKAPAWCVVPSTKNRPVFLDLVRGLASRGSREIEVSYNDNYGHRSRALDPKLWSVNFKGPVPDHVLVIDDSWVTGSNAQGVAGALKASGVSDVSIFTVANVLEPSWEPNQLFISTRLSGVAFEKTRCPWTGGPCP